MVGRNNMFTSIKKDAYPIVEKFILSLYRIQNKIMIISGITIADK